MAIPSGYGGRVYTLEENKVTGISGSEISTEASSADKTQAGLYFRFEHTPTEELPRDDLNIFIYNQSMSDPPGDNVTNHGTKTVMSCYVLLSADDDLVPGKYGADGYFEESGSFKGQLLSLDVDLAPARP